MRDLVIGGFCATLGMILILWIIPAEIRVPSRVPNPALSPAFWPSILAWLLVIAGVSLAAQRLWKIRLSGRNAAQPATDPPARAAVGSVLTNWRAFLAVGLLFPYYLACVQFGLAIPSAVAFVVFAILAGERRYVLLVLSGILLTAALTTFFIRVANILVPLGPLRDVFW